MGDEEANKLWGAAYYPKGIKPEDVSKVEAVREAFATCANKLQELLPDGFYKNLVKGDLQKVGAMATKAYTHGMLP